MFESSLFAFLGVLVPVVILLLSGAGWLIQHERERREAIESQLSQKKFEVYTNLIDIFFGVLKASRTGQKLSTDLSEQMIDANKDLLVFGSDEVFLKYHTWASSQGERQWTMLHKFGDVILAIRKNMGHPNTRLSSADVLRSFIIDFDAQQRYEQVLDAFDRAWQNFEREVTHNSQATQRRYLKLLAAFQLLVVEVKGSPQNAGADVGATERAEKAMAAFKQAATLEPHNAVFQTASADAQELYIEVRNAVQAKSSAVQAKLSP